MNGRKTTTRKKKLHQTVTNEWKNHQQYSKKEINKQTNASPQTQQVVFAFCIFIKSKRQTQTRRHGVLPLCRNHTNCLYLQKQNSIVFFSYSFRWFIFFFRWSFVVAKHLTKPIICYRQDV